MALKVTPFQMWIGKIEDKAGGVATVLEPLAKANVDLEFVLARRTPEEPGKGVVFVTPIKGPKVEEAARAAGMSPAGNIAGLRVEGDNKPEAYLMSCPGLVSPPMGRPRSRSTACRR